MTAKTCITASEWQRFYQREYRTSIGNVEGYEKRLKKTKEGGKVDYETQGKIRALQALILFS